MAKTFGNDDFLSTAWTQILEAQGRGSNSTRRRNCLEMLAENYWAPVFAYVRRHVRNEDDAHDLTQAYFENFLDKNFLDQARPERGRFRAFVLTSLKNFLCNQADRRNAARRVPSGGLRSLDAGDSSPALAPAAASDPVDAFFMREWARSVFARALELMERECGERGQLDYWTVLECDFRGADGERVRGYAVMAEELH